MHVVIVGGGITGLATAHALAGKCEVTLVERGARLGGNIITEKHDGFTIDGGPDSWIAQKPHATALARAVGLEADLIGTNEETRRVYVAHEGALHPIPEGLILAVPTKIMPVVKSGLFTWRAKARMALEPFLPRRPPEGDDDESVAHFVRRRLGHEVSERLAAPMLGGIFAGDAERLSIRATFPQLVELEKKYGSLVRAMRVTRGSAHGKKAPSAFTSLRGGVGALIEATRARLGDAVVRTSTRVTALAREGAGWRVDIEGGEPIACDAIVLTAPAYASASLLRTVDREVAAVLEEIRYVTTATMFLAYRRADVPHPLDAVGFIVPRAQGRPILASTWVSSKWDGRAPEGHVLLRAFFGGAWGEETARVPDAELVAISRNELRHFMGISAEPLFTQSFRFDRASPQPDVGHLARMKRVRARLATLQNVYLAGTGYDGVGIPDCIRQASEVAAAITAR